MAGRRIEERRPTPRRYGAGVSDDHQEAGFYRQPGFQDANPQQLMVLRR